MHDLAVIRSKQDAATLREYREAIEDGNIDLAWRIARANPDLFPGFRHFHQFRSYLKSGGA